LRHCAGLERPPWIKQEQDISGGENAIRPERAPKHQEWQKDHYYDGPFEPPPSLFDLFSRADDGSVALALGLLPILLVHSNLIFLSHKILRFGGNLKCALLLELTQIRRKGQVRCRRRFAGYLYGLAYYDCDVRERAANAVATICFNAWARTYNQPATCSAWGSVAHSGHALNVQVFTGCRSVGGVNRRGPY
jgi:hypothetical protein